MSSAKSSELSSFRDALIATVRAELQDGHKLTNALIGALRAELRRSLEITRTQELRARENILTAFRSEVRKHVFPLKQDVAQLKKKVSRLEKEKRVGK
jgi:hypothetical protein